MAVGRCGGSGDGAALVELMAAHDVIVGFGRHGELVTLDGESSTLRYAEILDAAPLLLLRAADGDGAP